jgi:hypothetical protein
MKSANRKKDQKTKKQNALKGTLFPVQIQSSFILDKVIRFRCSAQVANAIVSNRDLLDLWCMAMSATSARRLPITFKLKKVELWGTNSPLQAPGVASTVAIEDGLTSAGNTVSYAGPSRRVEDTALGISRPSHVLWKPPKGAPSAGWLNDVDGGIAFQVTAPPGLVLDVHIRWMIGDDGTAGTLVGAAVSGATTGANYIRSLNSNNANNLVPVDYPTI